MDACEAKCRSLYPGPANVNVNVNVNVPDAPGNVGLFRLLGRSFRL